MFSLSAIAVGDMPVEGIATVADGWRRSLLRSRGVDNTEQLFVCLENCSARLVLL